MAESVAVNELKAELNGAPSAPLLKLKLLDALKSNDLQKVDALYKSYEDVTSPAIMNLKALVLHLAIQVSSTKLFEGLLNSHYSQYLNTVDDNGNTPLHVACQSQRHDIIEVLLNHPLINDTIVNHDNQQPLDLIRNNPNLFNFVQMQRLKYVEKVSNDLRRAFTHRDFKLLNQLYANPRNFELLDINGLDPETGDTVLHEFLKKRDVEMVQWILAHGGDPFKRDKRGKLPIELISKLKASGQADQLKKILKKASKEQSVIDPVSNTQSTVNASGLMEQAPTFKGYLKKWTNFASGYKLRWFILDSQGILSYYKNQDDINSNCRGSINLKNCRLHLDSSEKLKFEILGVRNANIKWHLKGNHSVETNRWVWAILNAIKFAKDKEKALRNNTDTASILGTHPNSSSLTLGSVSRSSDSGGDKKPYARSLPGKTAFEYPPENHLSPLHAAGKKSHSRTSSNASAANLSGHNRSVSELSQGKSLNLKDIKENRVLSKDHDSVYDLEDDIEDNASEAGDLEVLQFNDELESISADSVSLFESDITNVKFIGPFADQITILQKSLLVELNSLNELVASSVTSDALSYGERQSIIETANRALESTISDYRQLLTLIHKNNFKIVKKLNNELQVNDLWESSIKELEQENIKNVKKIEHYEYERKKLRKILRDKLLHSGASDFAESNDLELSRIVSGAVHDAEAEAEAGAGQESVNNKQDTQTGAKDAVGATVGAAAGATVGAIGAATGAVGGALKSSDAPISPSMMMSEEDQKLMEFVEQKDSDSDSDDEFFDVDEMEDDDYESTHDAPASLASPAVVAPSEEATLADQTGTTNEKQLESDKPSAVQENGLTKPVPMELNPIQEDKNKVLLEEKTYNGYEDPIRVKLSKDEDDRPKISLWGILKSMIGKDMTKITLPVSFNECTSLLQRVAEGVEYTELLDKAASMDDSTLRLCYVAAFGASEYASTINRVAKPFNPLLGETFEYARPDKNFRFFTEQVSHHPPISAALAESPKWDYYGESAVKSKFNGRSFDIKPLGKWFLQLRPDHFVKDSKGNKIAEEELYTWNRVTSSVVGIMIGNPVVDNYGDMNIVNHVTGDHVVLSFKARGWRASSAYEVKGTVYNKKKEPCYLIKGHWDSKIFCKKISKHENIDTFDSDSGNEKFLLWQVNPRPPRPFNLTLFSISLNALQPHLKAWLAPTDTRLRPDQRAMEDGRYDEAAEEKNRVEEKQRTARKEREEKNIPYKSKFFAKDIHPITKDAYWKYNGEYWKKRSQHALADTGDIF